MFGQAVVAEADSEEQAVLKQEELLTFVAMFVRCGIIEQKAWETLRNPELTDVFASLIKEVAFFSKVCTYVTDQTRKRL